MISYFCLNMDASEQEILSFFYLWCSLTVLFVCLMNIFNDKAREGMTNGDIEDWIKMLTDTDTRKLTRKCRTQLSFMFFHYKWDEPFVSTLQLAFPHFRSIPTLQGGGRVWHHPFSQGACDQVRVTDTRTQHVRTLRYVKQSSKAWRKNTEYIWRTESSSELLNHGPEA